MHCSLLCFDLCFCLSEKAVTKLVVSTSCLFMPPLLKWKYVCRFLGRFVCFIPVDMHYRKTCISLYHNVWTKGCKKRHKKQKPGCACSAISFKCKSNWSWFLGCRIRQGSPSLMEIVCCCQVKRILSLWWKRWNSLSCWRTLLSPFTLSPTSLPTGVVCISITLMGAWKRHGVLLHPLASSQGVSFYSRKAPSQPGHHNDFSTLCSKAQICCVISFSQLLKWKNSLWLKRLKNLDSTTCTQRSLSFLRSWGPFQWGHRG